MGLLAQASSGQAESDHEFERRLESAALERTTHSVHYDGRYRRLDYPGGDVPDDVGVCTDVVIRAFRGVGIDLQERVHEDMLAEFAAYPNRWGLQRPDPNIDHRRVPNLQTFFTRAGESLPPSDRPEHYRRGDLVTWLLPGNLPHIGIVVSPQVDGVGNPMIVHNAGAGPRRQDVLFDYPITGHYRFFGQNPGLDSAVDSLGPIRDSGVRNARGR